MGKHGMGTFTVLESLGSNRYKFQYRIWAELPDESRKRLTGRFSGTEKELRAFMQKVKLEAKGQGVSADPGMTVNTLIEEWLDGKAQEVSARTASIYRGVFLRHIRPRIGGTKVRALDAARLKGFYTDLRRDTDLERTRVQIHLVLRQALDHAVLTGVILSNPAKVVRPATAKAVRREALADAGDVPAWTHEEASKLFAVAMEDRSPFGWAVALGLQTGLRRGELLGLKWSAVDLAGKTLKVVGNLTENDGHRAVGNPKTRESRRVVPLSEEAVRVLKAVREWRDLESTRPGWGGTDFVFPTVDGKMQHPSNINRKVKALTTKAGVRYLSMHATRHTFVTLLAATGVSLQHISKLIGHKTPLVTMTVYSHVFKEEVAAPVLNLTGKLS
ncbi:site-specific integrase [Deinococcus deserti]|uniref:Putative phage integrase n=1 Tax=Deinococcus deserti (strain DSM 17065 / CIP 109153 / LMG 22923 / VCD115) TaxID=546414 RepID=C1CUZ9_DEIDV|nr:site-specific integrase [Deinococcus deserti]ACO46016.1 putative phage integrase [Deinococcus deserti VCD115]